MDGVDDDLNKCKFNASHIEFGYDFLLFFMAGLGLVSGITEGVLEVVEHRLAAEGLASFLQLLSRVYKELMLLGIMGLVLILVRDFAPITKNQFEILEFAHLWLFMVGFSFIFQACMAAVGIRNSKRRWDNSFAHGLKYLEEKHEDLELEEGDSRLKRVLHFLFRRKERLLTIKAWLWVLRKNFIVKRRLPRSFCFTQYLRFSLNEQVLSGLNLGWATWLVLAAIFVVGGVTAHVLDNPPASIDFTELSIISICLTWCVLLGVLAIWFLVHVGYVYELRNAGLRGNIYDFSNVLHYAKQLYHVEGNDVLDPHGALTADEVRLDRLLEECRRHEHIDDPNFQRKHKKFNMTKVWVSSRPLLGCLKPNHLASLLKTFMLGQAYVFGLTLFVLIDMREGATTTAIVCVCFEMVTHFLLVVGLFPRIMRDLAMLRAISIVDKDTMDRFESTLKFQEQTNQAIHELSLVLNRAYNGMLEGSARCGVNSDATIREQGLDKGAAKKVFLALASLDKSPDEMQDCKGHGINARNLQMCLDSAPFGHHMPFKRIKKVFRALNCHRGFELEHLVFLLEGLQRVGLREQQLSPMAALLEECFPKEILCRRCNCLVHPMSLAEHSQRCLADNESGTVYGQLSVDTNSEVEDNGPPNSILKIEKQKSSLRVRNARFGLLRPLLFNDNEIASDDENDAIYLDGVGEDKEGGHQVNNQRSLGNS